MRRGGADLNILVGAVGLSALGDWLALVPLTLHLQEATGSGITIALLYIAFWAPSVVLAGPAGLLADRYDPRRVLLSRIARAGDRGRRARIRRRERG